MLPTAILSNGLHRTSSDIKGFASCFGSTLTVLIPANFYDQTQVKIFQCDQLEVKPLVATTEIPDWSDKIKNLNLKDNSAAAYGSEIKQLLLDRYPLAISIIEGLEEAKKNYQILLFITNNEAFIHERIILEWCHVNQIPTLHVNHGLILNTQYGAYSQLAADYLSTTCENELDFIEETLDYQPGPEIRLNGMPSWDKYRLLRVPGRAEHFRNNHAIPDGARIITFFPTIRNNTYVAKDKNKKDPHLEGIRNFISNIADFCKNNTDFIFFIKDRPGNEKFISEEVALLVQRHGIPAHQVRYVFDHAEPYVAFSDVTLATKSTIAGESVLCGTPHINIIESLGQALAFDYDCNILHLHVSELSEFFEEVATNPSKLTELSASQSETNLLTGPSRDFCSSLRVARLMGEIIDRQDICDRIDSDMLAWQSYLQSNPSPSIDDLLEDASNPLRYHWQNVASLLQFDHRFMQEDAFKAWLARKEPTEVDGQLMGERVNKLWSHQPTFHLIFIADTSLFDHLADSLNALDSQIYSLFGVSILSTEPCPDEDLLSLPYLQWVTDEQPFNRLNSLIDEVDSNWVLLLLPGDELTPDALFNLADYANLNTDWLAIYGDEDSKIQDAEGKDVRADPYFKPDFNLELLRSSSYTGNLVAFRRDAIQSLDGLTQLPYVQTDDFLLRLAERMTLPAIGHVPFICSHRSPALNQVMGSPEVVACNAIVRQQHLGRCGYEDAVVEPGLKPGTWQITYPLASKPSVAILIPFMQWHKGVHGCLQSLFEKNSYENWELFIAGPDQLLEIAVQEIGDRGVFHQLTVDANLSKGEVYNQLAKAAESFDYLCFLESDTHCVQDSWLERLLCHAQRPEVGMVAPRLVTPSARVFSAGQIMGMNGVVGDLYKDFHLEQDLKTLPRAWCDQNFSALNSSCVVISQENFTKLSGFNSNFGFSFYLTDLGLRLQLQGKRLHWTPYSTLACQGILESVKEQQGQKEKNAFIREWFNLLSYDPAHNINLQLRDSGHLADFKRAVPWHPIFHQQYRILLVPLWLGVESAPLAATLGYHMKQLQNQEKIRFGSFTVETYADTNQLPHLFEIARADADLVIFVGEEKGDRKGMAKKVKELCGCKIGLYSHQPVEQTEWKDSREVFDLLIEAKEASSSALALPVLIGDEPTMEIQSATDALNDAIEALNEKV